MGLINFVEVFRAYLPFVSLLLIAVLIGQIAYALYRHEFDIWVSFFGNDVC